MKEALQYFKTIERESIETTPPIANVNHTNLPNEDENFLAWDDVKDRELNPTLVQLARKEAIAYVRKMSLYNKVPISKCWELAGKAPIATRWIDTNKQVEASPLYRPRLVAKEIKRDERPELFAATPPLGALRMLISSVASRGEGGSSYRIMTNDVSRAYFHALAKRRVFVQLPPEDILPGEHDLCGELDYSMYGARDAALNWSEAYGEHLLSIGFQRGVASPCLFYHPARDIKTRVHGGDYVSAADPTELKWLKEQLGKQFEIKTKLLGPDPGQQREITVLNRILGWHDEGVSYEADARHTSHVSKDLQLEKAKEVSTPGSKDDDKDDMNQPVADTNIITMYRAVVARFNYLTQGRPDIAFATKECARSTQAPATNSMKKFKRLGRDAKGSPRAIVWFHWQWDPLHLDIFTDADWAGCRKSHKSTSGGRNHERPPCNKMVEQNATNRRPRQR